MTTSDTRKFAKRFATTDRRLKAVERAAQTGFRSVSVGESIDVTDDTGSTIGQIGGQVDGSVGVVDLVTTAPVAPTDPDVAAGIEQLAVGWDGGFVEEQPSDVTVAYVGVHVVQDIDAFGGDWEPTVESELQQITPGGGVVVLPGDAGVDTSVVLVAVSASGVWSEPTEPVVAVPSYALTVDDLPGDPPDEPLTESPDADAEPFSIADVIIRWADVPGARRYRVYGSLTSPVTLADEVVYEGTGNAALVNKLGGVALPLDEVTPTYYAVEAINNAGAAGVLGAEDSAIAKLADQETISALYAYLGKISAGQLEAGTIDAIISISTEGVISVGDRITIAHPDAEEGGITIWGDDAHTIVLVRLHPDGSYFDGLITAQELTVVQSLRILGSLSAIASGARVKIENGVADPAAPVVTSGDITVPHVAPPSGYVAYGIAWDNSGSLWWQLLRRNSDNRPCIRSIDPFFVVAGSIIPLEDMRDAGESYWSVPGGFAVDGPNQRCYLWSGFATSGTDQWRLHRYELSNGDESGGHQATLFDNGLDALRPTVAVDGANVYYQGDLTDLGIVYKNNLTLDAIITRARIPLDAEVTASKLQKITSMTIGTPDLGDVPTLSFHEFETGKMYNFTMVPFSGAVPNLVRNSAMDFDIGLNFWHGYSDTGIISRTLITRARAANVTTMTTTGAHGFMVGEQVKVNSGDASMNGTFIITAVPTATTFSYANAGADVAATGTGGQATTRSGFYAQDQSSTLKRYSPYFPAAGEKVWAQFANINGANHTNMSPESAGVAVPARKWAWVTLGALPSGVVSSEVWVGYGAASPGTTKRKRTEPISGRVQILYGGKRTGTDAMYTTNTLGGSPGELYDEITLTVTNKVLTTNVATLTFGARHDFRVGDPIVVAGVDAVFNGAYTITAVTATTISYAKVNANVGSAASGGTVTGTYNRWKGNNTLDLPGLKQSTPITGVFVVEAGGVFVIADQYLKRVGRLVQAYLVITRASGFNATSVNCATIPDGFKPAYAKSSPTSMITLNTSSLYRFNVTVAGKVQVGQSAANANAMILDTWWITDDPFP